MTSIGKYRVEAELGSGAFSTVYQVRDNLNNKYAMKVFDLTDDYHRDELVRSFDSETRAFRALSASPYCHDTLVCMYESFYDFQHAYIVSELMDGDLQQYQLSDEEFLPAVRSLLEGLAFIHANNLAHQDIKPANFLYKGSIVKIGDFGILCGNLMKHLTLGVPECSWGAGSSYYMCPQSLSGGAESSLKNHQACDMWSMGISLYELLYDRLPYPDWILGLPHDDFASEVENMTQEQFDKALEVEVPPDRMELPIDEILDIISRMIRVNENERITAQDALNLFDEYFPSIY